MGSESLKNHLKNTSNPWKIHQTSAKKEGLLLLVHPIGWLSGAKFFTVINLHLEKAGGKHENKQVSLG